MVRIQRPRGLEFWTILWMIGGATGTWLVLQEPLLWPLLFATVPMFLFSALLWLGWRWPAWGLIVLFSLLSLLLALGMLLNGVTLQGVLKLVATLVSIWELFQYWRGPHVEIEPEWLLAVEDSPWELESSEPPWDWDEEEHYEDYEHEEYEYEDYEEDSHGEDVPPGDDYDFQDGPHRHWPGRRRAEEPDWDWRE